MKCSLFNEHPNLLNKDCVQKTTIERTPVTINLFF